MRFVAVGDVMVDVVCDRMPRPAERVHGSAGLQAGGSAVNAALAAAEAGASAAVVGRIGNDPAGDLIVATLETRGIASHLARDGELPTGVTVAIEDAVVADRGANARFSPDDVPPALQADAMLVSGFALFQDGSRDAARTALDRFDGIWAAVDLASPKLAQLPPAGNVVFATAEEARALTGHDPEEAARELAKRFAVACVKLGADGAIAVQGGEAAHAQVQPVARASPFGAGDAFAAVFLVSLVGGDTLGDALTRACAAGARAAGPG